MGPPATRTTQVVVLGSAGRLGRELARELDSRGFDVSRLTRSDVDVTRPFDVASALNALKPRVIVNCTAYNAVDDAERDPRRAFAVNAAGPAALAEVARRLGAVLVHYSTDFVFDGTSAAPYREEDDTRPLGVYGASKLAGEHEVRKVDSHYLLRVESLFGGRETAGQRATVDRFIDSLSLGQPVRAFVDRTVSPSYVADVARATAMLIERQAPFGTYHCVSSGFTTWHGLALELANQMGASGLALPSTSDNASGGAQRPRYCALSNAKLARLGVMMPSWKAALTSHLRSLQLTTSAVSAASAALG